MKTVLESKIDLKSTWYFGNNLCRNLQIHPPKWYSPFFLTNNYEYAEDYADYGVYKIFLDNESESKILDFYSIADIKKLPWPKVVLNYIKTGSSDLNSMAYDLYKLAFAPNARLLFLNKTPEWEEAAEYFKNKSKGIFNEIPKNRSVWGTQSDHMFLLQMWKDIYNAGFNGFMHKEFGNKILAVLSFKCIDKISIKPV